MEPLMYDAIVRMKKEDKIDGDCSKCAKWKGYLGKADEAIHSGRE